MVKYKRSYLLSTIFEKHFFCVFQSIIWGAYGNLGCLCLHLDQTTFRPSTYKIDSFVRKFRGGVGFSEEMRFLTEETRKNIFFLRKFSEADAEGNFRRKKIFLNCFRGSKRHFRGKHDNPEKFLDKTAVI